MKTNLTDLLTVMRQLYSASLEANWDRVEELDNQRRGMLDNLSIVEFVNAEKDKKIILELLELDQAVLALATQELEFVASQVTTTHTQIKVREFYQEP